MKDLGSMGDHLDLLKKRRAGNADITIILGGGAHGDEQPEENPDEEAKELKLGNENDEMAPEAKPVNSEAQGLAQSMALEGQDTGLSEMMQGPLAKKKLAMMMKDKKA